ncbi:MAG: hypothetical protein KDM63_13410, partial [Verrucomicrobiae bacterium]|nr:hypothetical protein [Verrucomicrobiae bacterium]
PVELCRRFSGDGLEAKLAIVDLRWPVPSVLFSSSCRPHGAAPQTGLAALAIAAACLPWLSPLAEALVVEHPAGQDELPTVSMVAGIGWEIRMPRVGVTLAP